jgi:hypothetical protein
MSLTDLQAIGDSVNVNDTTDAIWNAVVAAVSEARVDAAIAELGTVTIYDYTATTNVKTAVETKLASMITVKNVTVDVTLPSSFDGPANGQKPIQVTVAVTCNSVSKTATVDVVLTTAAE